MTRTTWIIGRLLQIIPTLLLIGVAAFLLARALPGNAVLAMLGDHASDATVDRLMHQMGLDQTIAAQFWAYVTAIAHGDFGTSTALRLPVLRVIADRLPVTLLLTGMALAIALLLGVPLAFLAALRANRWPDIAIRTVFQVGLSSPIFYLGLILLTVFAAGLRWFPVGGYGDTWPQRLHALFLPALTLALSLAAVIMRSLRASILQVLQAEFVDFATAKGLSPRTVLGRHVLRPAAIAVVTLVGLNVGALLGGAVITESVFAVPGVGRLMIDSIFARDYPVIQGLTLVLAILVSLAFLATDIVQVALDPRIGR